MNPSSSASTWGDALLKAGGYSRDPNAFFQHFGPLGLTGLEGMMILTVLSVHYSPSARWPSRSAVAAMLGCSDRMVYKMIRSLCAKGYLAYSSDRNPTQGGAWDFSGLFQRLRALARLSPDTPEPACTSTEAVTSEPGGSRRQRTPEPAFRGLLNHGSPAPEPGCTSDRTCKEYSIKTQRQQDAGYAWAGEAASDDERPTASSSERPDRGLPDPDDRSTASSSERPDRGLPDPDDRSTASFSEGCYADQGRPALRPTLTMYPRAFSSEGRDVLKGAVSDALKTMYPRAFSSERRYADQGLPDPHDPALAWCRKLAVDSLHRTGWLTPDERAIARAMAIFLECREAGGYTEAQLLTYVPKAFEKKAQAGDPVRHLNYFRWKGSPHTHPIGELLMEDRCAAPVWCDTPEDGVTGLRGAEHLHRSAAFVWYSPPGEEQPGHGVWDSPVSRTVARMRQGEEGRHQIYERCCLIREAMPGDDRNGLKAEACRIVRERVGDMVRGDSEVFRRMVEATEIELLIGREASSVAAGG
jgi:hypothetical protein